MASAKTSSRSRGTPVKENGTKLEEGLNVFKSDRFNADSYVQSKCSLNEKVRWLPVLFFSLYRNVRADDLSFLGLEDD
jgi:hypothetical protein